jgi:putative transposase
VESFHGKLRDEFLNLSAVADVADAKAQAAWFKREYNTVRPHSGLGYRTPKAYAATCGGRITTNPAGGNPPVIPAAENA